MSKKPSVLVIMIIMIMLIHFSPPPPPPRPVVIPNPNAFCIIITTKDFLLSILMNLHELLSNHCRLL